ncbi:MAG: hypothetical protein AB1374_10745 [Bacillota bacterium]
MPVAALKLYNWLASVTAAVRQRGGVSVMSPVEFLGLWYKTISDSQQ